MTGLALPLSNASHSSSKRNPSAPGDANAASPCCQTIEQRLCEIGNLVAGQFPMTQRDVIRNGKHVGTYYCVHGPRSVKLTAIHDLVRGQTIYYGSDGIRREAA